MVSEHTSRRDAMMAGATRYFTGRPCRNGHTAERYVTTGGCIECLREHQASFRNHSAGVRQARIDPLLSQPLTLRMHPDDHSALYTFADQLNAARGLPPVARPVVDITTYERYLTREMRRLPGAHYGLIAHGAAALGIAIEFGPGRDEMHWRRLINRNETGADPVYVRPAHLQQNAPTPPEFQKYLPENEQTDAELQELWNRNRS